MHLLAMVSGFALLGYIVATARPSALWNQATWWQSIAVWFVAAVVALTCCCTRSTRWPTGSWPG